MSLIRWIFLAVLAYLAHSVYQRIQLSRKKAQFIRDRRRAAGIPDDDRRPFAVARADALSRRSQQKREEVLSTPVKRRLKPSSSSQTIEHDAALRLSGIPGTLPGYLKDSVASSKQGSRVEASRVASSPRSPSPVKQRDFARSPPHTMKRQHSQTLVDRDASSRRSPTKDVREDSPSARRNRKRRHQASPTKSDVTENNGPDRRKTPKISIPGDFGEAITDEDMSDAHSVASDTDAASTAMDEDEDDEHAQTQGSIDSPLQNLSSTARTTAKKREADELSSASDSDDTADEDEQPHTKRSRTANRTLDPLSPADFSIALPEEAMLDFNPFPSPSGPHKKRAADTSSDRQPGEQWTDYEGLHWRIDPSTHALQRQSEILEWRAKHRMPRDSLHPQAREAHQVVVRKWLTQHEWEDARSRKLLSFQEAERAAERENAEREERAKMARKHELLAKIRDVKSPKRMQYPRRAGTGTGDVSMASVTEGDASMSLDSIGEGTPGKTRRRIALAKSTPARGGSAGATPTDSPRTGASPLASPYRSIAYSKKKGGNGSPLVSSFAVADGDASTL